MRFHLLVMSILMFGHPAVIETRSHHRHGLTSGCSRCPPGHWVTRHCSRHRDTECQPCRPGSYLPHHSYREECYLCSRCGPGLYEAHPCQAEQDTICDSCHTYKGPHNQNYLAKCKDNRTSSQRQEMSRRIEWKPHHHGHQVVIVMVTSAVCSTTLFGLLALCFYYKWRRRQDRKINAGIMYTAVETQDAVML